MASFADSSSQGGADLVVRDRQADELLRLAGALVEPAVALELAE
jgi:hypothetical protein